MNLGVALKAAEKVFGPALPGPGRPEATLSAVRYAKGGKTKFAGVLGVQENANFYVHFPTPVEWALLETKKGIPDYVTDLKESGPQGQQGREALAAGFLSQYEGIKAKIIAKKKAAGKKAFAAKHKAELSLLRERLIPFVGDQNAILVIGNESISLPIKISMDKKGKLKITASL